MSRSNKQPLTGGKRVAHSCRNNGTCPYCTGNRTIASKRGESAAVLALREYLQTAPPEELEEDWVHVKAMNLTGPTLSELMQMQRAFSSYLPLSSGLYDA